MQTKIKRLQISQEQSQKLFEMSAKQARETRQKKLEILEKNNLILKDINENLGLLVQSRSLNE